MMPEKTFCLTAPPVLVAADGCWAEEREAKLDEALPERDVGIASPGYSTEWGYLYIETRATEHRESEAIYR